MLTLTVTERKSEQKPHALRGEGLLPAVLYGPKEETASIGVVAKDFKKVLHEAGESAIIELVGVGNPKEALIHDVAFHPVTDEPLHADFYVIEKDKKLTVSVPLEFEGTSPAVKGKGGTLVKVLHELEIEVLPRDLPHEIKVDISSLTDFDSQIAVKDLTLPEGVTPTADSEEVVASVAAPKSAEEMEANESVSDVDMSAVEVEGEKADSGDTEEETSKSEE